MTAFRRTEKHYKMSDDEFESKFQNCQLDPIIFTHEAHLRLAYIHIQKYGEAQAIENIRAQLKDYVNHVGEKGKYHDTVTVISIKEIALRMLQSKQPDFKSFMSEFPELQNDFKSVINSRYTFDVFPSKEAKESFIAPDKTPYH